MKSKNSKAKSSKRRMNKKSEAKSKKRQAKSTKHFESLREAAFQLSMSKFQDKVKARQQQIASSLEDAVICRSLGLPESLPSESRAILGHTMAMNELGNQLPRRTW
jgi:hypothetical protein